MSKKGLAAREADGAGVFGRVLDPGIVTSWGGKATVVEESEKAAFGRCVVLRVPDEDAGSGSSSSAGGSSVVARWRASLQTA